MSSFWYLGQWAQCELLAWTQKAWYARWFPRARACMYWENSLIVDNDTGLQMWLHKLKKFKYSMKPYRIVLKRPLDGWTFSLKEPLRVQSSKSTSSVSEMVDQNGLSLIQLLNFFKSELGGKSWELPRSFLDIVFGFISVPFYGNFQPYSLGHCSVLQKLKATLRLSELRLFFFFCFCGCIYSNLRYTSESDQIRRKSIEAHINVSSIQQGPRWEL